MLLARHSVELSWRAPGRQSHCSPPPCLSLHLQRPRPPTCAPVFVKGSVYPTLGSKGQGSPKMLEVLGVWAGGLESLVGGCGATSMRGAMQEAEWEMGVRVGQSTCGPCGGCHGTADPDLRGGGWWSSERTTGCSGSHRDPGTQPSGTRMTSHSSLEVVGQESGPAGLGVAQRVQ